MKPRTRRFNEKASVAAVTVAALVMLPLFAVLAFVMRFVLLAAAILVATAGLAVYAFSPRFREWIGYKIDPGLTYNGLRLDTGVAVDRTHGWARFAGDQATLGADDLAQKVLGPVEAVELPLPGSRVARGEPLFRLHHGERTVMFRSPVSGTVMASNHRLCRTPRLLNESPFEGGWAVRVGCDDARAERRRLLRGAEARGWFRGEVDRLLTTLVPAAGAPSLPDGGGFVSELHGQIDDSTWVRITNEFFTPRADVAVDA